MSLSGSEAAAIMGAVDLKIRPIDARVQALIVAQLATLTLMIEAGLTTVEGAARRFEQVRHTLPEPYQAEIVATRLGQLVERLRLAVDDPGQ